MAKRSNRKTKEQAAVSSKRLPRALQTTSSLVIAALLGLSLIGLVGWYTSWFGLARAEDQETIEDMPPLPVPVDAAPAAAVAMSVSWEQAAPSGMPAASPTPPGGAPVSPRLDGKKAVVALRFDPLKQGPVDNYILDLRLGDRTLWSVKDHPPRAHPNSVAILSLDTEILRQMGFAGGPLNLVVSGEKLGSVSGGDRRVIGEVPLRLDAPAAQ